MLSNFICEILLKFAVEKFNRVQKSPSQNLTLQESTESYSSPALLQHTREKSTDRSLIPDYSKSQDLLRNEAKSDSRHRSRKIDEYDLIVRGKEPETDIISTNMAERKDDRLGYTVAQYGSNSRGDDDSNNVKDSRNMVSEQTISSRTFTDDGRGTVTSTFTTETRYSSLSPTRTYEFAKGTVRNLPYEERGLTPTTYKEIRAYEVPKTKDTNIVPNRDIQSDSRTYLANTDSHLPYQTTEKMYVGRPHPPMEVTDHSVKERSDRADHFESADSFETDDRSYGMKPAEYHDLESSSYSVRQYGTGSIGAINPKQAQLRYFGDESLKSNESGQTQKSDLSMIKPTYERNHTLPRDEEQTLSHTVGSDGFTKRRYEENYDAPILIRCTTLKLFFLTGGDESESYFGVNTNGSNYRCSSHPYVPPITENMEESMETLKKNNDIEITSLPVKCKQTADYMRAREEGKVDKFQPLDSNLLTKR
ncbi:unnamed protein product [Thelazia callipaeda]|uniref:Microtubule-associated protein futsch n=1 Tax=Thelazia callipaeda TaxID=103827 RepID=A0A158RCF0_THECL|nr:unnamed protein product [Thelazia callipaeda]